MLDRIKESAPFLTAKTTEKQEYSQIGENESEDGTQYQRPSNSRHPLRWQMLTIAFSFVAGVLTMTVFYTILSSLSLADTPSNRNLPAIIEGKDNRTGLPLSWSHGDCGNSPEDAMSLNCQYSIVLHAWLPKDCLTEEDVEDEKLMYEEREWPYRLDNGTNMTMDQLHAGQYHHFTTTFDWHVTHCMYVWKRVHRSMNDGKKKIDSYTANIHHTYHCVKMIGGNAGGMKDSGTKIFVKYPVCA
ncbi:hypothetical protein QQS21_012432 [Conoideocrella luteorostrata]|uniref:Uncharacterized protein n=1 Tax=Conoideocrella luteorostrata TaxID=1105319 RepID=A0AAJ0CCB2_9HYPO|nr:hypothetical protein QQS21_012432 [Conoideocrella luteorostrata]